MRGTTKKLRLPELKSVSLTDFDLYSFEPDLELNFSKSVFCLIGANGLGKTTFLNTLLFGLTGAIPDTGRSFQTAEDYYSHVRKHSLTEDYFSGRLKSGSLSRSSATVHFDIAGKSFSVTRELLGGGSISKLKIVDPHGHTTEIEADDDDAVDNTFRQELTTAIGLESYAQYVFLSHFVWTFDETRHLLIWDDTALNLALDIAFGSGSYSVQEADKLRKSLSAADSRGRNSRFAAKQVEDRIKQLRDVIEQSLSEDDDVFKSEEQLQAKHESLLSDVNEAQERVEDKERLLRDADAAWANTSAQLSELQLAYRQRFSERVKSISHVDFHPVIKSSIADDICAICSTSHISDKIRAHLAECQCPLCGSAIERRTGDENAMLELQSIDKTISKIRSKLSEIINNRELFESQLSSSRMQLEAAESAFDQFLEGHPDAKAHSFAEGGVEALKAKIAEFEGERDAFDKESKDHYKKRDKIKKELREYEQKLKVQYDDRADQFIKRFRELAEAFIGLSVDVELKPHGGVSRSGYSLSLKLQEQLRVKQSTVSESQGFFLDIALRMALSEFMAERSATIFVDTPEGSLDIAYEAKAGLMFSKFAEAGNKIVMTANLRSSHLVLRLAELQTEQEMQIERLTEWTELSSVQREQEHLFTDAYSEIDAALRSR